MFSMIEAALRSLLDPEKMATLWDVRTQVAARSAATSVDEQAVSVTRLGPVSPFKYEIRPAAIDSAAELTE